MTREIKRIQEPRNGIQYIVENEVREELKPFVFFDAGKFVRQDDGFTIGFHPHSGIGIITYFHNTDLHHKDSENNPGVVYDGGAQWIRAGKGVWHEEGYHRKHDSTNKVEWEGSIHQLWIQLPPNVEESEVAYRNLAPKEIPWVENVKVLTGTYKGVEGPMNLPVEMTYLDVYLKEGETWSFDPPKGQTTGFIYSRDGELLVGNERVINSKMAILKASDQTINVTAASKESNFIVVLTEPSAHDIVTRGGQIHTNIDSLNRSSQYIQEIGKVLAKH